MSNSDTDQETPPPLGGQKELLQEAAAGVNAVAKKLAEKDSTIASLAEDLENAREQIRLHKEITEQQDAAHRDEHVGHLHNGHLLAMKLVQSHLRLELSGPELQAAKFFIEEYSKHLSTQIHELTFATQR